MDAVVIKIDGAGPEKTKAICRAAGLDCNGPLTGFWRGFYFLHVTQRGQGFRHTEMMEAAADSLLSAKIGGLHVAKYYAMD